MYPGCGTLTAPKHRTWEKPCFHCSALASSSAHSGRQDGGESLDYFRRDGCLPSRAAAVRASMVLIPGFRSRGLNNILETRISSFHPTLKKSDRDEVDCAIGISRRNRPCARHRGRMYPRGPRIPRTPHGFQKPSQLRHARRRARNPAVPPNTRRDTRPAPRRDPIPGVPPPSLVS